MRRIAMLSVHSSPLAALGGRETGGMNVYIRELSKALATRNCAVDIFTRSQSRFAPSVITLQQGVRIVHLKAGPENPYHKNMIWSHRSEFLDNMLEFTRKEKSPYQIIHSHYWLSGWVGTQLARRWGLPLIHMFHTVGYLKHRATHHLGEEEPQVRFQVERQLMEQSDHITVASRGEKAEMIRFYGTPPCKISVVPCGVDAQLFRPLDPLASKKKLNLPHRRLLLFVGRIDPVKGIDILLKALGLVREKVGHTHGAHLLIIGGDHDSTTAAGGGEMDKLRQLAGRLGLSGMVTFLGPQQQELLPYYYSAADMCILPSRYESFGMVALEAMACGTPVIASQAGGAAALLEHESCCFVVPEEHENALAEKICLLLTNPSFKGTCSGMARERALNYGWHSIADRILALYQTVTANRCRQVQPPLLPALAFQPAGTAPAAALEAG